MCGALGAAVISAALLGPGNPAAAGDLEPFYYSNQNPLVQIFGLPPAEGARLTPAGQWQTGVALDIANNFTSTNRDGEMLIFDGETYRLGLVLRRGFGERLDLGVEIPYVHHDGGVFDDLIDGWHDLFGLPDGGRDDRPTDLLEYRYLIDGTERVTVVNSTGGIGDVSLTGGIALGTPTEERQLALRARLKLPTGDEDDLQGSGGTDFALSLSAGRAGTLAERDMRVSGHLGVLWTGDSDLLSDRQESVVGFGGVAFGWQLWRGLAFKTQLDVHSAFYKGETDELGEVSWELAIGGEWDVTDNWSLDFAVVEDIAVDTAPDAVFHFLFRRRF